MLSDKSKYIFFTKTISKYSLWLHNDAGSIMNEKDSDTLYKLPSNLIVELNKYIK